jgi:hypothetical protein
MDFVAFGFVVTSDGEGRVTAQSNQGRQDNEKTNFRPAQQVLTRAVINEAKLLGVEVQETKDHAITNAVQHTHAQSIRKRIKRKLMIQPIGDGGNRYMQADLYRSSDQRNHHS